MRVSLLLMLSNLLLLSLMRSTLVIELLQEAATIRPGTAECTGGYASWSEHQMSSHLRRCRV